MNKEGHFYALMFFLVLLIPGVFALTNGPVTAINPGHNSTQIFIQVNNQYITLQNAIDYGYLTGSNSSPITATSLPLTSPYHLASKLIVTLGGYNVTLQDAVDHRLFVTPGNSQSYAKSSIPAGGEYAGRINVNTTDSIRTLKYAVENNLLSSYLQYTYRWVTGAWSGCNGCGGNSERTVNCQRSPGGDFVSDSFCPDPKPDTWYSCACHWQQVNYYGNEYVGPCVCHYQVSKDIGLCGYVEGSACSPYRAYTVCSCGVTCGPTGAKLSYVQCLPG